MLDKIKAALAEQRAAKDVLVNHRTWRSNKITEEKKMKKATALLIAMATVFALCATSLAASRVVSADLHYNGIKITLDGREIIPTDASGNPVEPFIIDGTTYLPVRGIASALGLDVQWDQATNTVILTQSKGEADAAPSKPVSTPSATTSQSNALRTAQNYLNVMAFSHDKLVKQLEYEGYSHDDAVYAADNCGADWNEQAVKAAKSYLDLMPFSRDKLIEQLEFEGYTHEQAVHGAEGNGY